jgi:TRAP-type C4-dicarboxylate transport system substrate-binding protein
MIGGGAEAAQKLTAIACLQSTNLLTKGFIQYFQKPSASATKGAITVDYIGASEVVPPRNAYRAVQRGQFDVLHCPTSYYAGAYPEAWAMLATTRTVDEIRKNGGFDLLDKIYQERVGAKLLSWADWATSYHLYLVPKPKLGANGLPDLRGMKLRASATYRPLIEALGGSTINMSESEVYTALQRGVIQGIGFTDNSVPQLGVKDIIRYRIMPNFYHTNTTVTMNLAKYNGLSKAEKDALHALSLKYEKDLPPYVAGETKKEVAELHAAGVQDIEIKGEARKKYLAIAYDALWKFLDDKKSPYAKDLKAKLYQAQ